MEENKPQILKMPKIIKLSRNVAIERSLTYVNWMILKLNLMETRFLKKLK